MRTEPSARQAVPWNPRLALGMALAAIAIVALGVFTEAYMRWAQAAVTAFSG